jgi:hypothetical protein
MSPADKIKLTNMVDQGVYHTLDSIGVTNAEEIMNHFERVAVSIVEGSYPEDTQELTNFFSIYLQKKADKLGVKRSYTNEQE